MSKVSVMCFPVDIQDDDELFEGPLAPDIHEC